MAQTDADNDNEPDTTPSRLESTLRSRYSTRLHMSLIIVASLSTALLTNRTLFKGGVETMWPRYLLASVAAYAVFFVGVWVWLRLSPYGRYLRELDAPQLDGNVINSNINVGGFGGGGGGGVPELSGGGRSFYGGGAAGDWDAPAGSPPIPVIANSGGSDGGLFGRLGGGSSSGGGGGGGGGGDVGDGIALIIAGILIALLLAAVFGSAVYIVYEAPHILSEVVFQLLLSAHMVRGAKAIGSGSWVRALFAATRIPFLIVSSLALLFAIYAGAKFPEAHTAGEVVKMIMDH